MTRDQTIVFGPGLIALVLVAVVLAVLAWRRREAAKVTVWEWQAGLLFRDGVFRAVLPPGRHVSGLRGLHVAAVSLNPRDLRVGAQEALTRDGFPVRLNADVAWRVTDARRFHASNGGADAYAPGPIVVAAQTALRRVIAAHDLDSLLAFRAEGTPLDESLGAPVSEAAAAIGAEVATVTLRDLHLPAEIRRMVTEVERAKREGIAALERARGEHAALRSLANAARLMRGNPELQALRTLQALSGTAPGRPAPTLVLGAGAVMPVASSGAATAEPDGGGEDS